MKFVRKYAAISNRLIDDTVMHYTSKIVFCTLAFMQRRDGRAKMTVAQIVSMSGLSEGTVLQALKELEENGFLTKKRNWRWSEKMNSLVYAANTYKVSQNFSTGYTLISSSVMDVETTPAGFSVLLYLYRCAGRSGRAYPSIRYIAGFWKEKTGRGLEISKSTIQRVLKQLEKCQAFVKNQCEARSGVLSCNSYYLTEMVPTEIKPVRPGDTVQTYMKNFFSSRGVPIFGEASISNKITGDSIQRKRKKGVGEFGDFNKKSSIYFDGTACLVSTINEQFWPF